MKSVLSILWCGWVLWSTMADDTGRKHMSAYDGYETRAECVAEVRTILLDEKTGWTRTGSLMKKDGLSQYFKCLPGSVDPREPRR